MLLVEFLNLIHNFFTESFERKGKKQLFYFLAMDLSFGKNKCAVCAAGFPLAGNVWCKNSAVLWMAYFPQENQL